jgi:hypothetical protein
MFANISRHPSRVWPNKQRQAALKIDPEGIIDINFPYIHPASTEESVKHIASGIASSLGDGVTAAMVQGEYSLTIYLSLILGEKGIDVYVASLGQQYVDDRGNRRRPFVRFRKTVNGGRNEQEARSTGTDI